MGNKSIWGILLAVTMLLTLPSHAQQAAKKKTKATAEWFTTPQPLTQESVKAAKAAKAKAAKTKRPLKTPEATGEVVDEHGIITSPAAGVEKTYVRTGQCYISQSQTVKQMEQSGTITIVECSDGTVYIKDIIAYNPCGTWVKGTKEGNTITIPTMQPLIFIGSRGTNASIKWGMKYPNGTYAVKADQSEPFTFTIEGNSIIQQNTNANFFMGQFYDNDNSFSRYGIYNTVWTEFIVPTQIDDLPYTPSFADLADQSSFTIINANNDGDLNTWSFPSSSDYARYHYNDYAVADDWLITPGIKLEAGKAYRFAIDTWASFFDERVEVKMGTDKTAEAMTVPVIASTDVTWRDDDKHCLENKLITVDEDGYYYFGIHAISDEGQYFLYVNNLIVEVSADLQAPTTVDDLTVVPSTSKLAATISFKAPTKNVKGEDLTGNLTQIEILRNGDVIKTFENVAPGSELSYVDEDEALTIGNYSYQVIAYNDKGKGLTSDAVDAYISNIAEVPYVVDFSTRDAFESCQVIDANGDNYTWKWEDAAHNAYYEHNDNFAGDDYLVSQPIHLEGGKHYVVTANLNAFDEEQPERFEVVLGRKAEAGSLTMKLIQPTEITSVYAADYSAEFTVPVEGNYYIAIHAISDQDMYYLVAHSLSVTKGVEPMAPAAVENFTATAGAQAALEVNLAFTAPTKTANASELSGDMSIDIYRDEILVKTFENVAPGTALTWKDENVGNGKTYTYQIIPSNGEGAGEKSEKVSVYVGYDVPASVEGAAVQDRFSNVYFSWNGVGTTGPNGAYVDPAQVTYKAWTVNIETYQGMQFPVLNQQIGEATGKTNLEVAFNTLQGNQDYQYFAIQPTNISGAGEEEYVALLTGKPYELPFRESFTDNNLHYFWETENARLLTSEDASDGDGAAVEILAKQTGGVFFESGKINIKDITNPAIIFDAKGTGVRALTVYVSKDGGDYQILQTAQLSDTYNTFQMPLTEVQDAEQFIRFKFKGMYMTPSEVNVSGSLVSKGNYVTLDAIRILDLYEHDLEVSMEAPASIVAGNTAKVKMTIKNNAENAATGFTLKLTAGNKVILDKTYEEDLDGFATLKAEADFATTIFDEAGAVTLKAEVIYDNDLNPDNNTQEAIITVQNPVVAAPENLKAQQDGKTVTLSWTTPTTIFNSTITESFEDGMGEFTTIDADGDGDDWIHHINIAGEEGGFTTTSGDGCVYSESYSNNTRTALNPDNWLVTPLAKLDGTFSFWACGQDRQYPAEHFAVFVSTTSATDPMAFKQVSNEYVATKTMTQYSVDLSEYAGQNGYIAIRHFNVTDQFVLVVDDVTYTPGNATPVSYNIYVDAAATGNTVENATELKELALGNHVFAVTAVYANGMESKPATTSLEVVTAINEILNSGKSFTIYTLDGKLISNQATSLEGLKGTYIVNNKKVVLK